MRKSRHTREGELLLQRLKEMARVEGLTSRELARRVGAFQTQVMRILHGDSKLDLVDFIAWCDACGRDAATEFLAFLKQIRDGRGGGEKVGSRRKPAK